MAEPSTSPLAANKPIKAKAVCDLPEPLSPTIPSVLPAFSVKFKSFTAVTTPSGVLSERRDFLHLIKDSLFAPIYLSDRVHHATRPPNKD